MRPVTTQFEPSTEGLLIGGLPAGYEPGRSYSLTLDLTDELMELAGLQAAIRFAEGERRRRPGRVAGTGRHARGGDGLRRCDLTGVT